MRNDRIFELEQELKSVVSSSNLITDKSKTKFYRTGIRVGCGEASMVVLPKSLLQLWKVLEICINFDKIIILQAANKKKGSDQPNLNKVASITWDQVKDIAETKMKDLNAFKISSAMKMIAGTARSMGVKVKGAFPENVN